VSKDYGAGAPAVADVSLDVAPGEFMTFLGPSGSGKTTTLNMIAGFVAPTAGAIRLGDQDVSAMPPHRRGIGMVFQHYALFPHMTVAQNIAYPLRQRGVAAAERERRVAEALEMVGLDGYGDRRPAQLSGGQQQRVALARALVFRPPLLLMDEPLGALDRRLREKLQTEIRRIHHELGVTLVYVTHDQDEALMLSDRIAVFADGRVVQVGTPDELYERPASRFVAEFLGDSNVFTGELGAGVLRLPDGSALRMPTNGRSAGRATVVVRPERMRLVTDPASPTGHNGLPGQVVDVHYLGTARKVEVRVGERSVLVHEPVGAATGAAPGDRVVVSWSAADCVLVEGAG
jgi:putative spermidine/putrescine transport system ATP-binding protein